MKILVTGAAGFIGLHLCRALLARGGEVVGIDNLNDYYDVALKQARLDQLHPLRGFRFQRLDVADANQMLALFAAEHFDAVVHLAAQAGVRYSLQNPHSYTQANLVGMTSLLEACRHHPLKHLVFASSSSVYGRNAKVPFKETDPVDHPVSFYAATKRANELMAHSYAHLYGLPTTVLRFFTVYGPWGRPDMAPWIFSKAILAGEPIQVFNHGNLLRDFTYVDDIVGGVLGTLDAPPTAEESDGTRADMSFAPYRIMNIGNHQPVRLTDFISTLETALGVPAIKQYLPMQAGDVPATCADTTALTQLTGFSPSTPLALGLEQWVKWYRHYHQL